LITASDMAAGAAPLPWQPQISPPMPAASLAPPVPLTERILLIVLFVTVLASSIAFIEPSPHDALMGVLAFVCLVAGVRFDRRIALLLMLLLVWNAGGLLSLLNLPGQEKTIQYTATSIYLAVAALIFACVFADNTMPRLTTMRVAYVTTAVGVALAGIAGYFNLFPDADMFAPSGRALGAFKDPNVFGPFLIWPALFAIERMLGRRISLVDLVVVGILLFGLLLSFSRGAWFHFTVSAVVMVALAFLTAPSRGARLRVLVLSIAAAGALAAFVLFLLSFSSIGQMFQERAHLIQSYDVGQGGRFRLQELALSAALKYPNGMGPFGFASTHANQQHNVYLQAFLVYGWIGGVAYIQLVLTTFWVALRSVFVATPWQPYIITALAAFTGEVAEGFIIDSDHWRHFFLLLGMIWGLWAATVRYRRQRSGRMMPARQVSYAGSS
jgi:hypothetical protein